MGDNTEARILVKLEEQEKSEGTLPPLFVFYRKLLAIQGEVTRHAPAPEPSGTVILKERLAQGLPLLTFADITLDWALVEETFGKVKPLFLENAGLFGVTPDDALSPEIADYFLSREAVRAWFEGTGITGDSRSLRESFLESMVHASVRPFLMSYSRSWLGSVDQERWRRRVCPVCGGQPDFAYLEAERGARWLLCSRCDANWLFQRLECPYCGTTDQNALAYYTDETGRYRLYVCDRCQYYIKAIDLRQTGPDVLLPLERLLTLSIDAQAQEYGYGPGGGNSKEGEVAHQG